MSDGGGWYDAHCHLSDPRLEGRVDELVRVARERGARGFVLGGVDPEDWARQRALAARFPGLVFPVFGLHPWWVDANGDDGCDQALSALEVELGRGGAVALGELGLDHGPRTGPGSWLRQDRVFREQLGLARRFGLPLVLHVVKAHEPVFSALEEDGPVRGIVHAFAGGAPLARRYLALGLHLSIGSPVTRKGFETLKKAVVAVPGERLLLESDAPDGLGAPVAVLEAAEALGGLRGEPTAVVLEGAARGTRTVFGL